MYGMKRGIQIIPPHDTGIAKCITECLEIRPETYKFRDYLTKEYEDKKLYMVYTEESPLT